MGRPALKSETDEVERIIHKRNVKCSHDLLSALIAHHGEPSSDWTEPVEAVADLPAIPNSAMAEASEMAAVLDEPSPRIIPGPIRAIQMAVLAEYPKFTLTDLFARRRTLEVCYARQIGMYLSKVMTGQSLPEIGRRFGGRDHTTVLHAVRKFERLV